MILLSYYGRSKLANLLFARELAPRLADTSVKVNAFHPGSVETGFWREHSGLFNRLMSYAQISQRQGAQTQIYLASNPEMQTSGQYWARKKRDYASGQGRSKVLAKKTLGL